MIDKNGRLFGRVSVIDIIIVLAVLVLGAGFVYRQTSARLQTVINPSDEFYVVFEVNGLREVNTRAIAEGDLIFRIHDRQPLGEVVDITLRPATQAMHLDDATVIMAEMEERYRVFITLASVGSITEVGYFVNGLEHLAPGLDMVLVSNRLILPVTRVAAVGEERPTPWVS